MPQGTMYVGESEGYYVVPEDESMIFYSLDDSGKAAAMYWYRSPYVYLANTGGLQGTMS